MRKYAYIFSMEIKKSLVYRGDTFLTAIFGIFSVVLAYLLWKAVFGGLETFGGFTLPQMTTYYLLLGALRPFTQDIGMLDQFSSEIKNGTYSKYMVRPVSTLAYFISASFGRAIFSVASSLVVICVSVVLFPSYFAQLSLLNIMLALPIVILGSLLSIVLNYIIAMATFRFTDIGFIFMIQNILLLFFTGALIPLSMVFGDTLPMFLPFSYMVYYPVMFCLGLTATPIQTALPILFFWVVALMLIAIFLEKRASKSFEGVGI